ncbi:MAG: hypothetical protein A3I91_01245 [Candidatus Kerfeldbacteria bacterium RIFCSPLOWO2_02_FULL_42_19]|nr:MAG: hypothetical protein A3I91_01245 [Candidatus Kerfeldbacteria bacterium RIFCSPLOWO2_02_FULL_42_19]
MTSFIPLVSGIFVSILGFFVLIKNPKKKLNILFCLLCLALIIWLFASFPLLRSVQNQQVIFWDRIVYIGVIFVPTFIYHFALEFTNVKNTRILRSSYYLALIFLVLSRSEYFVNDVFRYQWGIHTQAKILHDFFLLFFGTYIGMACMQIYTFYKKTESVIKKEQAKYILIALMLLVFVGSWAYLPAYNISIFPFAYFAGVLFSLIVGYAITRCRFLAVSVILKKSIVVGIAALLEIMVAILLFRRLNSDWLIFGSPPLFFVSFFTTIFIFAYFGFYFISRKIVNLFWRTEIMDISKILEKKFLHIKPTYTMEDFKEKYLGALRKDLGVQDIEFWVIKDDEILYSTSFKSYKVLELLKKVEKHKLILSEEVEYLTAEKSKLFGKIFQISRSNAFMYCTSIWKYEGVSFLNLEAKERTTEALLSVEKVAEKATETAINIYVFQKRTENIVATHRLYL